MKIGLFAKENNVSIDTVRHYMDLRLLLPIKNGSHYDFDDKCSNDMAEIIRLKNCGFSLKEIQPLLDFKRLSAIETPEYHQHIKETLNLKKKTLSEEINVLNKRIENIETEINAINTDYQSNYSYGVNIGILDYLACPDCQNHHLSLESNHISNNMIFNGKITCKCGYEPNIEDGILIDPQTYQKEYNSNFSMKAYIENTDPVIISNIRKGINWFSHSIKETTFENQVIIELGSGSGFFIRSANTFIESAKLYMAIDYDLNRHIYLKTFLETSNIQLPLQFICCNFERLPFKKDIFDSVVDFTGSSNYAFENPQYLLDQILPFCKKEHSLYSSYILFEKFSLENFIPPNQQKHFIEGKIQEHLKELGYTVLDSTKGHTYNQNGPYEDYFNEKDLLSTLWIHALKSIKSE